MRVEDIHGMGCCPVPRKDRLRHCYSHLSAMRPWARCLTPWLRWTRALFAVLERCPPPPLLEDADLSIMEGKYNTYSYSFSYSVATILGHLLTNYLLLHFVVVVGSLQGEGASCFYEGNIWFERNMGTRQNIFWQAFCLVEIWRLLYYIT
jgi:hypothetical protein